MPKLLRGTVRKEWKNMEDLRTDIQTLDTASMGALRFMPRDGSEAVATDLLGVRNDRTGRVVAAVGPGYQVVNMPDIADLATRVFEARGLRLAKAIYHASDARQELTLLADFGNLDPTDSSPYLAGFTVRNSFDGTKHVEACWSLERLVCSNGARVSVAQDLTRYKHNKKGVATLEDRFMAWTENTAQGVVDFGTRLVRSRGVVVDPTTVPDLLRKTFGQRAGDDILELVPRYGGPLDGKRRDPSATDSITAWTLYQAATDHFSHTEKASASFQSREVGTLKANALLAI